MRCTACHQGTYKKGGRCDRCGEVFMKINQAPPENPLVEKSLENLAHVYCRLKPSPIGGIGVFAIRSIPAGINPFDGIPIETWVQVPLSRLKGTDKEVMRMVLDFGVKEGRKVWMPLGGMNALNISYHLNHSKTPNMKAMDGGDWFTSARAIKAGEELTVDYDTYEDEDHRY